MTVRVAAAQWPIEQMQSLSQWQHKVQAWLQQAASLGAQLAIVPEYASMELTSALPAGEQTTLAKQLAGLQAYEAQYWDTYRTQAHATGLIVVAGSFPAWRGNRYVNLTKVLGPAGLEVNITKSQMTRFEAEQWGISAGDEQAVIVTPFATIGVAICYDSEFPLITRRLVDAGANLVCVPSCTDTLAGYHRVRVACQARALENQIAVVSAPTVGSAPWSLAVDENIGAAGAFCPPDRGLPDNGVITSGELNQPGWVVSDIDLRAIDDARNSGAVFVHRDWNNPLHLVNSVTRFDHSAAK